MTLSTPAPDHLFFPETNNSPIDVTSSPISTPKQTQLPKTPFSSKALKPLPPVGPTQHTPPESKSRLHYIKKTNISVLDRGLAAYAEANDYKLGGYFQIGAEVLIKLESPPEVLCDLDQVDDKMFEYTFAQLIDDVAHDAKQGWYNIMPFHPAKNQFVNNSMMIRVRRELIAVVVPGSCVPAGDG